jgi:hypothetical protein
MERFAAICQQAPDEASTSVAGGRSFFGGDSMPLRAMNSPAISK